MHLWTGSPGHPRGNDVAKSTNYKKTGIIYFQRSTTNLPKQSLSTNQTICGYCSNKTRPTHPSAPAVYQTNLPGDKRPQSYRLPHEPAPSQQLHSENLSAPPPRLETSI